MAGFFKGPKGPLGPLGPPYSQAGVGTLHLHQLEMENQHGGAGYGSVRIVPICQLCRDVKLPHITDVGIMQTGT